LRATSGSGEMTSLRPPLPAAEPAKLRSAPNFPGARRVRAGGISNTYATGRAYRLSSPFLG